MPEQYIISIKCKKSTNSCSQCVLEPVRNIDRTVWIQFHTIKNLQNSIVGIMCSQNEKEAMYKTSQISKLKTKTENKKGTYADLRKKLQNLKCQSRYCYMAE